MLLSQMEVFVQKESTEISSGAEPEHLNIVHITILLEITGIYGVQVHVIPSVVVTGIGNNICH